MRLLWFGDMSATGFGSVTSDVGRELLNLGHDARFVSQNDLGSIPPPPFDARTLDLAYFVQKWDVHARKDEQGVTDLRDIVAHLILGTSEAHLANGDPWGDWKPEACILLGDFVAARLLVSRFQSAFTMVPTFHYVPIEGTDLPPSWGQLWESITPIAMSRFGQAQIAKVTGKMPPLAYHGVDTTDFHPPSASEPVSVPVVDSDARVTLPSRDACRRYFGGDPAETWVLRTDRNMPRKRYGALLRAMLPVLTKHPDVRLVLHCGIFDQGGYLPDSISKYPEAQQRQVYLPNFGALPRQALNALYAASDLYVSTGAEGFGLCIAEALACGIPAVGLDYSAVPEVIGPAGRVVPIAYEYDNEYDHKWATPDEDAFAEAVDWMVSHPARRRELGALGPKHVRDNFQWAQAARVIADVCAGQAEAIAA